MDTMSDSPMNESPLHTLPLEVLLRIQQLLPTPDLSSLRLVSRYFFQALDRTFILEFFTRKQFMLSTFSLQALIDISQSRLGPHLKHVHFGLDRVYPGTGEVPTFSVPLEHPTPAQMRRHKELCQEYTLMIATGYHVELLTTAFANLKNLESVIIRDFNSQKRTRDGRFSEWRSYGEPTIFRETAMKCVQAWRLRPTRFPAEGDDYASRLFMTILSALGKAQARPKGIEVLARHGNHVSRRALAILPRAESEILPVVQNLERLHLDMQAPWVEAGDENGIGIQAGDTPFPTDTDDITFCRFLTECQNVKHLRLNQPPRVEYERLGTFLRWLANKSSSQPAPTDVGDLVPSPAFPHLEELNFGYLYFEESWILDVIARFAPTLKRLELWKVCLFRRIEGDPATMPKTQFWPRFLQKLRDIPGLNLHHIKIGMAKQKWQNGVIQESRRSWGQQPSCQVAFGDAPELQYTGPDWKHFINEAIPKVTVSWETSAAPMLDFPHESIDIVEIAAPWETNSVSDDDETWEQYALDI